MVRALDLGFSAVAVYGLLTFTPAAALAEPAWAPAVGAALERARDAQRFPALAAAVVVDGQVALATASGTTEPGGGTPVAASSRFRLASVSKSFTAVTLLRLVQAGKLGLDDAASARCPAFAPPSGAPTLRQLALHQGGMRHFSDREDETWTGEFARLSESVARFGREKLLFPPGERTFYSSPGYAVLGCAIETASGAGFFETLAREVLAPASIPGVLRDRPDLTAAEVVPGFRIVRDRLVPSEVVDTRFKTPASGLVASVDELARFVVALYGGKLLPPDVVASMFVPARAPKDEEALFTLGWQASKSSARGPAVYSAGSMEGSTALLVLIPGRKYAVALLGNRERAVPDLLPLLNEIHDLVLGKP